MLTLCCEGWAPWMCEKNHRICSTTKSGTNMVRYTYMHNGKEYWTFWWLIRISPKINRNIQCTTTREHLVFLLKTLGDFCKSPDSKDIRCMVMINNVFQFYVRGFARFINVRDNNGATPLHLAARFNHPAVVRFLLSKGALVCATTTRSGGRGWDFLIQSILANYYM